MYKSVSKCNLTQNELVDALFDIEIVMNNRPLIYVEDMRCFAGFGTICTIKKSGKHAWRSVTFTKVAGFSLELY